MGKFIVGVIVGIVVATVGIDGIANVLDLGVAQVQDLSKQLVE